MRAAVIGGGVMGTAIMRGAFAAGVLDPTQVVVAEVVAAKRETLETELGVATVESASGAVEGADLVIVAVKPQDLATASVRLERRPLVVSIMAGVTIETLQATFGNDRVVRVMPNMPAAIGAGMSAWTATSAVTPADRELVGALLGSLGEHVYVADESKIDIATAVNGSGPGFVFLLMEAMIDAAVAAGLPRAQALPMVIQTFYGSAAYALETGTSLAELRAQVTSPGGTTAAGLVELERLGARAAIMEAVRAAHERAGELGRS